MIPEERVDNTPLAGAIAAELEHTMALLSDIPAVYAALAELEVAS